MLAFIDSELTGLFNKELPLGAKEQARLAEIALLITTDDFQLVNCMSFIVKPMPDYPQEYDPQAIALHGITPKVGEKAGLPFAIISAFLFGQLRNCSKIIAHGTDHDLAVLKHEISFFPEKTMVEYTRVLDGLEKVCTMKYFAAHYHIQGTWKGKWTSLGDMYRHLFQEPMHGSHRAYYDTVACWRSWAKMVEDRDSARDLL